MRAVVLWRSHSSIRRGPARPAVENTSATGTGPAARAMARLPSPGPRAWLGIGVGSVIALRLAPLRCEAIPAKPAHALVSRQPDMAAQEPAAAPGGHGGTRADDR